MVLRHDRTANEGIHILWERIGITRIDIFIYVFKVYSVLRKSAGMSNCRNIDIEPLAGVWLIGWNKYAWFLTSTNYSNNFIRRKCRDLILFL